MQNTAPPAWDDLRVLLAIHRHRSFLAAGRALGVSTSTVARRVDALEGSLGRKLVHRSSAGTSVEPDALELVSLAEQLELGLSAARRDEDESAVSGTVRVTMGQGFVRPATRVLSELRRTHPELVLEIVSETRLVDVARREADIAIRKSRSSSPVLVEKRVGELRFSLYASPGYVERRLPEGILRAGEFAGHDFVGYDRSMQQLPQQQWLIAQGAERFSVLSNSDFALQEAAEQGQGICVVAEALGRSLPGLVELDTDVERPSVPVYLAFHRELRRMPRVRLVTRTLEAALRHGLA